MHFQYNMGTSTNAVATPTIDNQRDSLHLLATREQHLRELLVSLRYRANSSSAIWTRALREVYNAELRRAVRQYEVFGPGYAVQIYILRHLEALIEAYGQYIGGGPTFYGPATLWQLNESAQVELSRNSLLASADSTMLSSDEAQPDTDTLPSSYIEDPLPSLPFVAMDPGTVAPPVPDRDVDSVYQLSASFADASRIAAQQADMHSFPPYVASEVSERPMSTVSSQSVARTQGPMLGSMGAILQNDTLLARLDDHSRGFEIQAQPPPAFDAIAPTIDIGAPLGYSTFRGYPQAEPTMFASDADASQADTSDEFSEMMQFVNQDAVDLMDLDNDDMFDAI